MKKLIFATNNPNKLKEIRSAVSSHEIISLNEIDIREEINAGIEQEFGAGVDLSSLLGIIAVEGSEQYMRTFLKTKKKRSRPPCSGSPLGFPSTSNHYQDCLML